MAERANARQDAERAARDTEDAARFKRQREADVLAYMANYPMTEAAAREALSGRFLKGIACACVGGPHCCQVVWSAARRTLGLDEEHR